MKIYFKQPLLVFVLLSFLYSCSTYNKSMSNYYNNIKTQQYEKAQQNLETNKLINKSRNALLFNEEMGRLMRLQNKFEQSNIYLNRADAIFENSSKSFADVALGNLINPMEQTYLGEDYEQFMVHFYKALNYINLGKMEDAVVEARRINLSNNKLNSKYNNSKNKYSNDAFALNLQGMIYEAAGDINNAFIAYRNSAEIYGNTKNLYYGVSIPEQLQNDVARTGAMMGFTADTYSFNTIFNLNSIIKDSIKSELILFIEEGNAPIKIEKNFFLTSGSNGINSFNYIDGSGNNNNFNFDFNAYGLQPEKLADIRGFRIALPTYEVQNSKPIEKFIQINGINSQPQLIHNLEIVAVQSLKDRFIIEMGNALARQITKKITEKATEIVVENFAKNNDNSKLLDTSEVVKQENEKKKIERAKNIGNIAGFAINALNTVTEKADTRNWQSLPAFISYVRIPLIIGKNTVTVTTKMGKQKQIEIIGNNTLKMMSIVID